MVGRTSAPPSGAKPLTQLFMLLMAAALCLGLMPIAPAWADEPAPDAPAPQAAESAQASAASADATVQQPKEKASEEKADASQEQAAQPRAKVAPSAVTVAPTTVDGKLSIPDPLAAAKFSVVLTVVDATESNKVIYNGAVENMAPGSTVLDMLKAAGFTQVSDLAATAGNDRAFFLENNSPYFLGKEWNATTGTYWTTVFDGSSGNWKDAMADAKLKMGGHYQYIYGKDVSTFAYSDAIPDPLAKASFPAALTVIDAVDGKVVYNGAVENMAPGSTVLDMLKVAGFTQVSDLAATAGNDRAFFLENNSPYFLGKEWNATTGTYWTTVFDGSSGNWKDAMADAKLKMGGHYQYIYGKETSFSYGLQNIEAPAPQPDDSAYAVCAYDAAKAGTLQQNLTSRFSRGGVDAAIDNTTAFAAIALNDLGLGANIDASAILASLAAYEETNGAPIRAGALAKYILALTAAGIDCTNAPVGGAQRNLVAEMEALVSKDAMTVYDAVMILPVYGNAGYKQGACSMTVQDIVDFLVASQRDNGLFTVSSPDSQTAAQAVLALIPYRSQASVSATIDKAVAAVRAMQLPDGSFAYNPGDDQGNLDATANIVAALAALGVDPLSLVTDNGSSPLGYVIAMADEDLAGYTSALDEDLIGNETMASATALLALAANQGYQKSGGAYNVYALGSVQPQPQPEAPADGDKAGAGSGLGTRLAPTGDAARGGGGAVVALAAAAAGVVALRRREVA